MDGAHSCDEASSTAVWAPLSAGEWPPGAQFARQGTRNFVSWSVERQVDRLWAGVAAWLIREMLAKVEADLLRTPQLVQLNYHEALQPLVRLDLSSLRSSCPLMSAKVRGDLLIGGIPGSHIPCEFPRDP